MPLLDALALPGLVDVHAHFMPEPVMAKVWDVFDRAPEVYGLRWPITYRWAESERIAHLRSLRVRAFTSLVYAHKPGMAAWLNEWTARFAARTPDCLHTATFFPEPHAAGYVADALDAGARVFKVHLQVGGFDPGDELLDPVWGMLAELRVPTVIHCGSGPVPGPYTGPGPITGVLERYPDLELIIAHMGAPEYGEFLDLADQFPAVRLDTTMAFTDFMTRLAGFPDDRGRMAQLRAAGLRGDVLFGSDFPNIPHPYVHQVRALRRLDLGDDWLREVLWFAGARLFGLEDVA